MYLSGSSNFTKDAKLGYFCTFMYVFSQNGVIVYIYTMYHLPLHFCLTVIYQRETKEILQHVSATRTHLCFQGNKVFPSDFIEIALAHNG